MRLPPLEIASRRAFVSALTALGALTSTAPPTFAQSGVPEGMKTSESYSNLQQVTSCNRHHHRHATTPPHLLHLSPPPQISPETTGTLGAGTMSSRSRPVTGVVLLEEVQESGKKDAPTVAAELVLDGGVAATATFQSEYPLVRGMFYDVEVKNTKGDGAFLQVARLPDGKTLADVGNAVLTKAVFSTEGRFGAYGAATDVKVLSSSEKDAPTRLLDVSFAALSPGQTEVPRRALVAAVQPEGSADVVMLVGSSTANAWKKAEPSMRAMAGSFRIAKLRKTSIARKSKNDYRFEDQGGLNEKATDNVMNYADL